MNGDACVVPLEAAHRHSEHLLLGESVVRCHRGKLIDDVDQIAATGGRSSPPVSPSFFGGVLTNRSAPENCRSVRLSISDLRIARNDRVPAATVNGGTNRGEPSTFSTLTRSKLPTVTA